MSYDIYLKDDGGCTIQVPEPHHIGGGTQVLGGTRDLWLNITYNYAPIFKRVLGPEGIRSIYGMRARDSIPILFDAASKLDQNEHSNYWEPTEGNARLALLNLLTLATLAPGGVWAGD